MHRRTLLFGGSGGSGTPGGSDTQAQYNNAGSFGGSSGLTLGATSITAAIFAVGSAAAPTIAFLGSLTTGFYRSAADFISFSKSTNERMLFGDNLTFWSGAVLRWTNGTPSGGTSDTILSRLGAGKFQFGNASATYDNECQIGDGTHRLSNVFSVIGTFGTNPATTGAVNIPNNTSIAARNQANNADISLIYLDTTNRAHFAQAVISDSTITGTALISSIGAAVSGSFNAEGAIDSQVSAAGVGNGADTSDDTLFTYTLPSNALSANGKAVKVTALLHFATNANQKTVKFFFAGTSVTPLSGSTQSNKDVLVTLFVIRVDSTHVHMLATDIASVIGASDAALFNTAVSDLTANTSIIKVTGSSNVTGAANDVLGYSMTTEFVN